MEKLNYEELYQNKMDRLLDIKSKILSSNGEDDAKLISELESLSNHPDPLSILLDIDEYTEEDFESLMFNYQMTSLPYSGS